jgi:flavin reductase (DIM6/NTAB) family NADH-FMN oxidoreductase RutF
VDRKEGRRVLSRFHYGLYIVGTRDGELPDAMIATWVTQVSFVPQLLAVAIEVNSHMIQGLENSRYFSINLLPAGGKEIAASFLKPRKPTKSTIGGREYSLLSNGSPCLREASACVECRVVRRLGAGDHIIIIGEVVDTRTQIEGDVLTMHETGWNYQR